MSAPREQAWCRRCGIVRRLRLPAWCRHNAIDCPAARMVPLPTYHPLHDGRAVVGGDGDE